MLHQLPNIGFIEKKLSSKAINKLKQFIKENKQKDMRSALAGNINSSVALVDKDNWFFENVLLDIIKNYREQSALKIIPEVLTNNCPFKLHQFWVNYQKKHEFNPTHIHNGVFSFVVWIKIPSSFEDEKNLDFIKNSNSPRAGCFEFSYTDILGKLNTYTYKLNSKYENTILFFPALLNHTVYPFYLSDEERISISGNICLDTSQVVT